MNGSLFYIKHEVSGSYEAHIESEDEPPLKGSSWFELYNKISKLYPHHKVKESKARFVVVDFFMG